MFGGCNLDRVLDVEWQTSRLVEHHLTRRRIHNARMRRSFRRYGVGGPTHKGFLLDLKQCGEFLRAPPWLAQKNEINPLRRTDASCNIDSRRNMCVIEHDRDWFTDNMLPSNGL